MRPLLANKLPWMKIVSLHVSDDGPSSSANCKNCITDLQHCSVCSIVMGRLKHCRGREQKQRPLSWSWPSVCAAGWRVLRHQREIHQTFKRDSAAGSVGRLLVWTACIPYNTTPVHRLAHISTASPTTMDEQAMYIFIFAAMNPNQGYLYPEVQPAFVMGYMERLECKLKI